MIDVARAPPPATASSTENASGTGWGAPNDPESRQGPQGRGWPSFSRARAPAPH